MGWFESIGSSDAIVFGLPKELHHAMLWELFRQIQSGLRLVDGSRVSGLIEGYDCIARPVHHSHVLDYFGFALWYSRLKRGKKMLDAFQIYWPGRNQGLFPWEPDCDSEVRDFQPLLYVPSGH
ncbi:MAG: DUF4262 domain-containing protein [Parvularculaceae bacterium]|nr:DUF4262 domain-containing protein [Parvularculaceae bacterium]